MMSSEKMNETKKRILEAAIALLEKGGPEAVRMSDIAKKAKVSRQAVYLHFESRAKLLIEATLYLDDQMGIDDRLAKSRAAKSGVERLEAYIDAWCNFIPEMYPVGKAIMAMQATDADARETWRWRMQDMREGCTAAIVALSHDGQLADGMDEKQATDLLWALLLVPNWETLVEGCGWSQQDYVDRMQATAKKLFVKE